MKIDGKKISEDIGLLLLKDIKDKNLKPSLGILCVGDDPASLSFINVKKRFGERFGFVVNVLNQDSSDFNDSTDFKSEIITKLKDLQNKNDAVILQLPLPENIRIYTDEILNLIEKSKDVDNLAGGNFEAPIVLALQKIFVQVGGDLQNMVFGVVGLGQVVGLPIYNYLSEKKFNVLKIERDNFEDIKKCDVIISGVGQANLISASLIKENAILIDYGCSWDGEKFCGDFSENCYEKSAFYTPVPGCLGPLVVASLFENTLKASL